MGGGGGVGVVTNGIEVTNADGSDDVVINIRCSNGRNFAVQVNLESSVESFKSVLAQNCDVSAKQQRLVYKGRILKDDQSLKSSGLEAEDTVHLIGGFLPAAASNNTTNTYEEGTMGGSGGSSYITYEMRTFAELERIQQRLFQNPSMLPETIYRLMKNPDAICFRMMRSPRLRQVIDRHPEFGSMLGNNAVFRRMAEAVICFEFIREMMHYTHKAGCSGGAPISPVGLDGHVIPGLEELLGSTPDSQNPTVMLILRLLSFPQNTNRMPGANLQMLNPQFRELMQHPHLIPHLTFTETMQQILALYQSLLSQRSQQQNISGAGGETASGGGDNIGLEKVMNMFTELTPNNNNSINVGPEELYARQLAQLKELDFWDEGRNLEALIATGGNLSAAVDLLSENSKGPLFSEDINHF